MIAGNLFAIVCGAEDFLFLTTAVSPHKMAAGQSSFHAVFLKNSAEQPVQTSIALDVLAVEIAMDIADTSRRSIDQ
jgi:hypothetical protein